MMLLALMLVPLAFAAWVIARHGLRPWILTPLLVPSYLVYHSLGLL